MNQPATCIIIEDEPLAMERTRNFVEKVPLVNLPKIFHRPKSLSCRQLSPTHRIELQKITSS